MALTQVSRGLLSTSIVDNGNATAITIDSSENVGIGTSPAYKLDVDGSVRLKTGSTGTPVIVSTGSDSQGTLRFGSASNEYSINSGADYLAMIFNTDGTEAMRIDASGTIKSSVNGAVANLILENDADTPFMAFTESGAAQFFIGESSVVGGGGGYDIYAATNQGITFFTNALRRVDIDSSGNLMVGKTSTSIGTAGHTIFASGEVFHTVAGTPLYVNRIGSNGPIQNFYKDGTSVGSIGVSSGAYLTIGTGDTGILFDNAGNRFYPCNASTQANLDATIDIGGSNVRFKDLYRSGSTISTSDRNLKQDIRDLTDAERNVAVAAKGLLKAFRFIDRVEEEGDSANIHFGIIAQDLAAAFTAEGLDANDYQVYRADTFTDDDGNEQTRLGICYENLLAFIISAI